jgi:Fe-S cluster assembly scaffold protein SufB
MSETKLAIFEQKEIRRVWDSEKWDWYFSVVDIVEVLAETPRPRKYWWDLKRKLKDEWSELSSNIGQLKMKAQDWKY